MLLDDYNFIKNIVKNSRVMSVGLDPMVAVMNNIRVIDGYHTIYPLSYKIKFLIYIHSLYPLSHCVEYFERIEFFCTACSKRKVITSLNSLSPSPPKT